MKLSVITTLVWILWSGASQASVTAPTSQAATQACERAVADELRELRSGRVQRLSFTPGHQQVLQTKANELSVQGGGRYVGAKNQTLRFNYRCGYNTETTQTTGVVLSDQGGGAPTHNDKSSQPADLSRVSSEACETAIVSELKQKYPRVGRIAFGSDSREIKSSFDGHPIMQGQGGMQPAPGMSAMAFGYRCEFNPQSGQLLSVKTTEKK
jgi:hypothetical protein